MSLYGNEKKAIHAQLKKVKNIVSVEEKGASTALANNSTAIQAAIDEVAALGGGKVLLTNGTLKYSTTLQLKDKVILEGFNGDTNASTLHFEGTGYAIVTTGSHLRQQLKNFNLKLNTNADGIRIGDVVANLDRDNGILPRQIDLDNIVIQDLATGKYGIRLMNASHITMKKIRSAYGTGGIGLSITCDGYNSGVLVADECSFGRHGASEIGLEMVGGSGGLDGYTFNSCYFGGTTPIKLSGTPRGIKFNSPHVETTVPESGNVNAVELYDCQGVSFDTPVIAGFSKSNITAFAIKGTVKNIKVKALDVNEFIGTVYNNEFAGKLIGCEFDEPSYSGATGSLGTSTVWTGIFDLAFRQTLEKWKTKNIEVNNLYLANSLNSIVTYGATAPTGGTITYPKGSFVWNVNPTTAKNISHWTCIATGAPGTWLAHGIGIGTTAEIPALVVADKGFAYKNTDDGTLKVWDGTAWI